VHNPLSIYNPHVRVESDRGGGSDGKDV